MRFARLSQTLLLIAGLMPAMAAPAIRACAADVEYPPFLFTASAPGAAPTQLRGLAVDVLQTALQQAGQPAARIDRYPWPRCLRLAEFGQVDMVLNVPTAQIDPKPFLITEPYAQVHGVYYVSRQRWPKGIEINDLEDLKRHNVCGLMGNRYEGYGIDSAAVDTGARTYQSLIGKLHAGHCDLFLEKHEVVAALSARDRQLKLAFDAPNLFQRPLPEDAPLGLHFAISRRMANGLALQTQLNKAIAELSKKKQLDKWLADYLREPAANGH